MLIPTTPGRSDRLALAIKSVQKSVCNQPIQIVIDTNNYEGFVKPFIRLINSVDGLALFLGDDAEVYHHTIQYLYNAYIKAFPDQDGMCASRDALTNEMNFRHPFAHTKTFREWTHPGYFHNWVDREWFDLSQIKDRYCPVSEAYIKHSHYTANNDLNDDTYRLGQATSDADGKLYYERRAKHFPS